MVSSPGVPMPTEAPPPPPPPPLMGECDENDVNGENNNNAVDAYGVPLGENPAGFVVARPPSSPSRAVPNRSRRLLPGAVGMDESAGTTSSTERDRAKKSKSASTTTTFFKQCFGGAPETGAAAAASAHRKQNALVAPSNSRRASSESYGAMRQRERDARQATEEDYGESRVLRNPLLNPNAQRVANSAEGAGTALPELILRMRIINLVLCTLALGLEIPFWIGRVVMLNLSELVLGVCLCGFALLLCCWEMHVPVIGEAIRDNFGVVHHPFGRSAFFVLMGGLCIGQGGPELYLGAVILLNAIYTIYIPCRYPHYYKAYEECGEEDMRDLAARAKARRQGHAWADQRIVQEEKQNLISKYSSASGE